METEIERMQDLPEPVRRLLSETVAQAKEAFAEDLKAVVLFGSAAEGRLRLTSDVNLIIVLAAFKPERAERLRDHLVMAKAAIDLEVMFLLESELPLALEAFAVKFADVHRRHRVLYGSDPFAHIMLPRLALVNALRQTLLNLTLRMRALFVKKGQRGSALIAILADETGPLRVCAAALLELQGKPSQNPKQALTDFVASFPEKDWPETLALLSEAREGGDIAAQTAEKTLLRLIELAARMRAAAEALS